MSSINYQEVANRETIRLLRNIPELVSAENNELALMLFIENPKILGYLEYKTSDRVIQRELAITLINNASEFIHEKIPEKVRALHADWTEKEVFSDLASSESGVIDAALLDIIFRCSYQSGETVLTAYGELVVRLKEQHGLNKNKEQVRRALKRLAAQDRINLKVGRQGGWNPRSTQVSLPLTQVTVPAPLGKGLVTQVDLSFNPGVEQAVKEWRKTSKKIVYQEHPVLADISLLLA